ncbi:hypothetical protein NPX13_g5838 [Xylaria arbuscula]|uniref:Nucleoside phosphorylase domain-containing protein n=1 Tax=Xylaria arbuscula TaxID=114810 RepID=A0A9W8NDQ5_9PEZI|nr:hypothetical protein NPX13_g5838 [Xylaria arbuscula]
MSTNSWDSSPPASYNDFEIAIICALPLEADAVVALFDRRWDSRRYRKAPGDTNTYSTGAIGHHNVVLVHLPNMGKVAAARAAACLHTSYGGIRLALVVGICGGIPSNGSPNDRIVLGDVVISNGIVQYDFGRQFPHGFVRKTEVQDSLPRPPPAVRSFLARLQTNNTRSLLQEQVLDYLSILQHKLGSSAAYPGIKEDWLFNSTYCHKHHTSSGRLGCLECDSGISNTCNAALKLSCQELGCNERERIPHMWKKPSSKFPAIHFGCVASSDSVMKFGEDRDKASRDGVIAFEMEGAGIWETFPGCLIIKGVCDYADSHKNKLFQGFAAATAAATTKAVLNFWGPRISSSSREKSNNTMQAAHSTAEGVNLTTPSRPRHLGLNGMSPAMVEPAQRVAVLKSLYASPYRDRMERNPDRVDGTCEWVVTHKYFQRWQGHSSSSMLLVSADPGCGKSVLSKYLVDHILPSTKSRTTCYFFFKDDFEDQRSSTSALCCILHQLFEQKEVLLSSEIVQQFETRSESLTTSFVQLWDILLSASQDHNAGEIICILDAFDECDDQGQADFTRYLGKLYSTRTAFNLKFLITTRPYGHIRRGFQPLKIPGLPVIHLNGEAEIEVCKISKEIDVYIKVRAQNIRDRLKLEKSEGDLLLQNLLRVPHRTYLWAYLTLDLIEKDINIDKTSISKAASQLPQTVDEAYDRILSKSSSVEQARKLLQIILVAERPLTVTEMNIALTIEERHKSYRDLTLKPEERFREHVRDACGLFVAIIGSRIYLLHQTAKEFLIQNTDNNIPVTKDTGLTWKSSLSKRDSHCVLAKICIWHILFTVFEKDELNDLEEVSDYVHRYNFLSYSAMYWTHHFRESAVSNPVAIESLLRICTATSDYCPTWFKVYWATTRNELPWRFSALMISCFFGIHHAVRALLKRSSHYIYEVDGRYERNALSWASENGFDDVVKLLLGTGLFSQYIYRFPPRSRVQIEAKDAKGRTPLSYAAREGHTAVVKRLISRGACVDTKDKIGGTPISYSLCTGQAELTTLLLRRKRIGSVREHLQPLLFSAAKSNDFATVELLLQSQEVNPNWRSDIGRTPLSYAAELNYTRVIEILLDRIDISADLGDRDGQTPIFWALTRHNQHAFQLLVESGNVNINAKDNDGRTPLSHAAYSSNQDYARLLLSRTDVAADLKDSIGRTPLSYAAESGNGSLVRLLLNKADINVNSRDDTGWTPLSWARERDWWRIVELLIECGGRE